MLSAIRSVLPVTPIKALTWWLLCVSLCYLTLLYWQWSGASWTIFALAFIFFILLSVTWLACLIFALRRAWKYRQKQDGAIFTAAAPFGALAIATAMPLATADAIETALDGAWFHIQKPKFEAIIDQIDAGQLALDTRNYQSIGGVNFVVGRVSNTQIAFEYLDTTAFNQYLIKEEALRHLKEDVICEPFYAPYFKCDFALGDIPFND